jgi:hypothetical protein
VMVRLDDASSKGARRSIAGGKPTGCDNVKAGSCMHPRGANRAVDRVRPEARSGTLD